MSTNQPGKPRIKLPGEDIDTTEGHLARNGRVEDADTEGHAIKSGRIEDADTEGHGRRLPPEDESVNRDIDSTEGHGVRIKGGIEEADTEGHAAKWRG